MARIDGSRPVDGRFFVTVVRSKEPRARVATDRVAMETAKRNMEAAKRNGIRAALSCVDQAGRHSVSLDAGRIVGGSAGLMFALAIVDALEPLEPDGLVAGTGAIAANGVVGPIGDIGLKARAASDAGADLFLAPKDQAVEAQRAAPGLRVVGVRTLDEAVRALGRTEGCDLSKGEKT
jgi:PDZ domain-containing secreted protein